ncbi:MAG: molybdopterin-dependent oxidoreductase, partial [Clostridiales Family XIII bacterium]|nr:molybdopterin-dependent oxidoreductase [Clostridiales Family XIII bacterium]
GRPIDPEKYDDGHPFIIRDSNKCILCGLCVRVCDEVIGVGALGLVNRGFDTIVKPTLEQPLINSGCISCGQCVSVCPTGALQERLSLPKSVPLDTVITDTTCPYCSVGCSLSLETYGDLLVKADPNKDGAVNKGLLCGRGKFGFDCAELEDKLLEPMMKTTAKKFAESDYYDAFVMTAKKAQSVAAKYGRDAVAVAISDRFTNEEIYAISALADEMGARKFSFNNRKSGLEPVLGITDSPNTIDELLSTDVILALGFNRDDNPVIFLKLKQAAEAGAKVVLVNPRDMKQQNFSFAHEAVYTANNTKFLKEIAKAVLDSGAAKDMAGYKKFAADLKGVKPSAKAQQIAQLYTDAKKAMIVLQQNTLTEDAQTLAADIALLAGHIGAPRDGILSIRPKNNSQGLSDQGIRDTALNLEGVKALLIFGEDPLGAAGISGSAPEAKAAVKALKEAEFVMVCDTHLTKTAARADVVIPGTGFASTDGTFTNTERRLMLVQEAADDGVLFSNWEVAKEIARIYEVEFPWEDTEDISREMDDQLPTYRYSEVDGVFGGVLEPAAKTLVPVADGKFADALAPADNLMNMISSRLPSSQPMPIDR